MIPETLEAAIEFLKAQPIKADAERMTEQEFGCACHHGVGTYLRNNWELWHGSVLAKWFNARGIHHADDMSGIILDSFWRTVNNQPIELEAQIKHYQDFWKRQGIDIAAETTVPCSQA
jgi:hypothetical protein